MQSIIVIPARIGSTRFPAKVLTPILGKPMIQYVYEGAKESVLAEAVLVATDSIDVVNVVKDFGGEAVLTSPSLPSGTDRVYEAVKDVDVKYIVNLQGDEPLIRGNILDAIFEELFKEEADIVTPCYKTTNIKEAKNPNRVKITTDKKGCALYFSRSSIPYHREPSSKVEFRIHIGIYGFTKRSLSRFVSLPQSELEKTEKLEQLRALENGMSIRVVEVDFRPIPVDVPEDVLKVERVLKRFRK